MQSIGGKKATPFPMETASFGSPWENLKKKLNEELTPEDLRNVRIIYGHIFYINHNKMPNEPQHEISNNVVCTTSKGLDQPVHTRSLIRAFACRLIVL